MQRARACSTGTRRPRRARVRVQVGDGRRRTAASRTDTEITISFGTEKNRDTLSWDAGCNSASADVEITDDRLVIDGDRVVTTLIGCPPDLAEQETWLFRFFDADPEWTLSGDELTLTSADTVIVFGQRP